MDIYHPPHIVLLAATRTRHYWLIHTWSYTNMECSDGGTGITSSNINRGWGCRWWVRGHSLEAPDSCLALVVPFSLIVKLLVWIVMLFVVLTIYFLWQCRSNCTMSYYFALVSQCCSNDILFCAFVFENFQLFKFSELWHKVPLSCPTKMQNTVL